MPRIKRGMTSEQLRKPVSQTFTFFLETEAYH
jgi:hypothetical protein